MDDDDYYRNADARDHRTTVPRGPVGWLQPPSSTVAVQQPTPQPVNYTQMPNPYSPMMPGYSPMMMPPGYSPMTPPGYFGPYSGYPIPGGGVPPGMAHWYPPGAFPGYPPPYWGPQSQSGDTARTIGRVLRAATPLVVALLPLPPAPTPIASTGDQAKDLVASLTNEGNQIAYTTALAQTVKRDEAVLAIGEGIGIFLEKGWS